MQAQERLVVYPSRSITSAIAIAATFVAAALAFALIVAVNPTSAMIRPAAVVAHQQTPDAQERNEQLRQAQLSNPEATHGH
jgi:hypothetical protein